MRVLIVVKILLCVSLLGDNCTKDSLIDKHITEIINQVDPKLQIGIKVFSLDSMKTIYEKNSAQRFVPASCVKLFTAAASLHLLGEDFRFETKIIADNEIKDGVLDGNCYLVGSGDPSLKSVDLVSLFEQLKGLVKVTGNLYIDTSCFDDCAMGPGWMWDERPAYWSVPMNGLNLDHNFVNNSVVQDSALFTSFILKEILQRKGIKLEGDVKIKPFFGTGKTIAVHYSSRLYYLLEKVLKDSDNLYANCIFKTFGASWLKSAKKMDLFLKEFVGVDTDDICIVDGSGESRYNLISPNHAIDLLTFQYKNTKFINALSICGTDGTLTNRMKAFSGSLRGKTGVMTGISALCGYLKTKTGKNYAIAIFENGYLLKGKEIKKRIEDELCSFFFNFEE